MGGEAFGDVETAFRRFLADAARLPDEGRAVRRALYRELLLISGVEYARWLQTHHRDISTIKSVGGRFIHVDDAQSLIAVLEQVIGQDA